MLISSRRQCAQNRGLIRGNAGLGLDHMPAGDKLALAVISESAARADKLFAEQDHDGAAVWRRIIDAVGQLAKMKPSGRPH